MANIVVDLHAAHGQRSLQLTIGHNDIAFVHQGHYQDIVKSIDIIKSIEFSCDIPWGYTSAVLNNLTYWVPIMSQPIIAHYSPIQHTTAHLSPLQHTTTHLSPLQQTTTHLSPLQPTRVHYSTPQPTRAQHRTPQHTTAHKSSSQPSGPTTAHQSPPQHTTAHHSPTQSNREMLLSQYKHYKRGYCLPNLSS